MIKYENDCVGCPQGCINCGRRHAAHYYCDECGEELQPEELYEYDDDIMLCGYCLLLKFDTVAQHLDRDGCTV